MAANPGTFNPGGVRVGGFVCGIIGTVLSGIYMIYWLAVVAFVAEHGDSLRDGLDQFREEMERQRELRDK